MLAKRPDSARSKVDYAVMAYFNGRTIGPVAISVQYAARVVRRSIGEERVTDEEIEAVVRAVAAERGIAVRDESSVTPSAGPVDIARIR